MEKGQKHRVKGVIKAGELTIEVEEVVTTSNEYSAKAIVLHHVSQKEKFNRIYWKEVTVTKDE